MSEPGGVERTRLEEVVAAFDAWRPPLPEHQNHVCDNRCDEAIARAPQWQRLLMAIEDARALSSSSPAAPAPLPSVTLARPLTADEHKYVFNDGPEPVEEPRSCRTCGGSGRLDVDYEDGGNYYSGPCPDCASPTSKER